MKRFPVVAIAVAVSTIWAMPTWAKDTSFALKGKYQGKEFFIDNLSFDECAKMLALPIVELKRADGARQIVPSNDVENRQCIATTTSEEPDSIKRFIGFPPVKVYNEGGAYGGRIQVGDGPKVDLNMAADSWSWEDEGHSYYLVDNLSVTDKKTGKDTCYQEDPPQFPCDVNPVEKLSKEEEAKMDNATWCSPGIENAYFLNSPNTKDINSDWANGAPGMASVRLDETKKTKQGTFFAGPAYKNGRMYDKIWIFAKDWHCTPPAKNKASSK